MVWALNHDVPMDDTNYDSRIKFLSNQTDAVLSTPSIDINKIGVYPTLVSDVIHLNGVSGNTLFRVLNFSGQEVASGHAENATLDLSNLNRGPYVLVLDNNYRIKIVKH